MHRHLVSCVTARLLVAVGRGAALPSRETWQWLLDVWLSPLMDDYRWLQHGCRWFDRAAVEDGIEQAVLTPDATAGGAAGRAAGVAGQVPQGRRRRVPQPAVGVRGVVEEDLHQAVRRAA
ncbi:BTB/POZ domain-containing protein [Zea mays]|uniref:BTB/POZ domain-containing protein n=1 Tax=Zea mays TaxID=4577 RepID=A0A3L6DX41_MAIZE|nr:BTB/POZ domain-containing protein [Zea mays]